MTVLTRRATLGGLADLQHLLLTDPENRADIFAGAGTPWYLTLFGRDSIWAARMMLPFGTELAAGTLRVLARRQGTVVDGDRAEAPGKIPHEMRRTTYVDPTGGLALPPVYYGTIDATLLWIDLLHEAWRWGLAEAEVAPADTILGAFTRDFRARIADAETDGNAEREAELREALRLGMLLLDDPARVTLA